MLSWRACFLTEPAYQLPTSCSYFWSTAPGPLSQAVLLSSWLLMFLIPQNSSLNSRLGPDCSRIQSTFFLGRTKDSFPLSKCRDWLCYRTAGSREKELPGRGLTQRTGFYICDPLAAPEGDGRVELCAPRQWWGGWYAGRPTGWPRFSAGTRNVQLTFLPFCNPSWEALDVPVSSGKANCDQQLLWRRLGSPDPRVGGG